MAYDLATELAKGDASPVVTELLAAIERCIQATGVPERLRKLDVQERSPQPVSNDEAYP